MVNKNAQKGFTIVELLVVIVVIGVLAAIVIVAYNGITNSAKESAVQSDLGNIAKKLEVYKATNGLYPANAAQLEAADFKVTQSNYSQDRNNVYYCRTNDYTEYAIGIEAVTGSQYYLVNSSVSPVSGGVSGANTCARISTPNTWATTGFSWNGTTGSWNAWTQ